MGDGDRTAAQWADGTRRLREEAVLLGGDWPATEPGFYVAAELRTCSHSVERATVALEDGDRVTAVLHARLMLETAIRLAWVKAPIKARDRAAIADRLRRLLEQDIRVLLAADDAVRKHAGFKMVPNRDEVMSRYAAETALPIDPAPPKLEALAREATQPALYGVFRYLSTLAHPGIGQKIAAKAPASMYWQYLRYSHAGAVLHGVALLDGLGLLESPADLQLNEAAYTTTGVEPR